MASDFITSWQIEGGKVEAVTDFFFLGSKITVDGDWNNETRIQLLLRRRAITKLYSVLESKNITLTTKVRITKAMNDLSSSYVWMWELGHEEGWTLKNWCFQIVVLEKTLESLLDCKKIKPVNPKGNQSWIPIGRAGAEAEVPILWPPDMKSRLIKEKPWSLKMFKAEGEAGDRGWGGWMASPIQWTWIWANFRRWWGTGKHGILQSMG